MNDIFKRLSQQRESEQGRMDEIKRQTAQAEFNLLRMSATRFVVIKLDGFSVRGENEFGIITYKIVSRNLSWADAIRALEDFRSKGEDGADGAWKPGR